MNKTIEINPALFNVGYNKSKKDRKHNNKTAKNKPIINPSVLKNKFLKRIKEHKEDETKKNNISSNKSNSQGKQHNKRNRGSRGIRASTDNTNNIDEFSDDFNESIQYLQKLSDAKKKIQAKKMQREQFQNKTVKNYNSMYSTPSTSQSNIKIDLPDELSTIGSLPSNNSANSTNSRNNPPMRLIAPDDNPNNPQNMSINLNTNNANNPISRTIPKTSFASSPISVNTNIQPLQKSPLIQQDVPYGCLKNGTKPTYRTWNKTMKKNPMETNISSDLIVLNSDRQQKLENLKNKMKEKQSKQNQNKQQNSDGLSINTINSVIGTATSGSTNNDNKICIKTDNNFDIQNPKPDNVRRIKKMKKVTTIKKYKLGRSKNKRTIGMLIKNRNTRREVLLAQRDLKQTSINDVKQYLYDRNLIKRGTNVPNDVIRKMYENAKLTGEVYNLNNDIIVHNLSEEG